MRGIPTIAANVESSGQFSRVGAREDLVHVRREAMVRGSKPQFVRALYTAPRKGLSGNARRQSCTECGHGHHRSSYCRVGTVLLVIGVEGLASRVCVTAG